MDKREKVINGLESCQECDGYTCRNRCPYNDKNEPENQATCTCRLAHDALALLKSQEPVEPIFERTFISDIEIYDCGKCGTSLGAKGIAKYCMKCGQAVKWG